jgi:hypothetical protein
MVVLQILPRTGSLPDVGGIRLWAASAVAVIVIAVPGPARAGTYDVRSCGASSPQAFALVNESPQTIAAGSECPQDGSQLLSGMYAGVASSGFTLARKGASWTIAAPAGLQLQRLDLKRSLGRVSALWHVTASTPTSVLEACDQGDPAVCRLGNAGGELTAYTDLNAPSVSFRLECRPPAPDEDLACVGRTTTQAWVAIYSATARVSDPAPPAVEPLPLAPGWHNGVEPLTVAAADASGIKSLSLSVGATTLLERKAACDYTRMQPCPASAREPVSLDTSTLDDGTYTLKTVATDAADQATTATTELKVDRHAPEAPRELALERTADGTPALVWTNPDQGTAAPIAAAHYEVCGATCAERVARAPAIARLASVELPTGSNLVRVWLEDEAGNADRANAATLTVDPSAVGAPRPIDLNPPVLAAGAAPSFRLTRARRSGSTLTLSGTIARAATARITAKVSRGRAAVRARATPRHGRWSVKLKLTSTLRRSKAFSATLAFAGQTALRASTIHRRLSPRPGSGALRVSRA